MRIVRVDAIPLTTPYGLPGAQTRERSAVFVEVEVADGTVGVGETYLGVYIPELAIEAVRFFEPFLIGRDGYLGFKMRAKPIAYQPAVETERVAAVREALGPDRLLAIDAVQNFNPQPWSVKQALDLLDRLAPYHLAWAEEFLPPFDPAPYAELRARGNVHISGG